MNIVEKLLTIVQTNNKTCLGASVVNLVAASGGVWFRNMAKCCLAQTPLEECWQVHKLLIAQQWKVTTAFGTVWVMDRCHAEGLDDTSSATS